MKVLKRAFLFFSLTTLMVAWLLIPILVGSQTVLSLAEVFVYFWVLTPVSLMYGFDSTGIRTPLPELT